ncbi:hypothetical protein J1N35_035106 [Gossypium stocksii]|uniref:Uncharacterized protein n=1 Tax=Gossypium stocksii TaxID=47602 RepID=A0A9D3UTM1_9ROSI|nr:hypothetical protein J1N35_035106 [Gossypium stocksii]
MEEEGGTGNRQEGSRTTSTESSHLERGRSRVKHEETRAPEIASTYYKPDGEGVKVEKTLHLVSHEQPPEKHQCDDTNGLQSLQTRGTLTNNRRRKRLHRSEGRKQ